MPGPGMMRMVAAPRKLQQLAQKANAAANDVKMLPLWQKRGVLVVAARQDAREGVVADVVSRCSDVATVVRA